LTTVVVMVAVARFSARHGLAGLGISPLFFILIMVEGYPLLSGYPSPLLSGLLSQQLVVGRDKLADLLACGEQTQPLTLVQGHRKAP